MICVNLIQKFCHVRWSYSELRTRPFPHLKIKSAIPQLSTQQFKNRLSSIISMSSLIHRIKDPIAGFFLAYLLQSIRSYGADMMTIDAAGRHLKIHICRINRWSGTRLTLR